VVFLIMQSQMEMVNPSYEEAARNLGARTPTIIRRVYFPLTIYGLLSSVTLNFLALFIAFSIPFILGASWPQFLSVFIYVNAKDKGDWLMGYTTSVIYIAISLVISYVYTRSLARRTAHV
jgi:putative spermidine/putrescine transport system permease protein